MQLDGPDLEELLVRARHEYGPAVRIIQADKVRTGGLRGFFARELYQLSVELDDEKCEPATNVHGTAGLLDLADAISDTELASSMPAHDDDGFTPGIPATKQAGPTLSTDSETFADILARLTETAGTNTAGTNTAGTETAGTTVETATSTEPAVLDRTPEPLPTRPQFAEPAQRRRPGRQLPRRPHDVALSMQDLRGLGFPPSLLVDSGDLLATLVGALQALPPVPEPPSRAGDIVAVVGDGETAWDAGLRVARSIGLDERAMVYVTTGQAPTRIAPARRVTGIEQLATRLDRWRKRPTPTVAVLDAPMSVKSAWWNRRALATLRAQAVWLVVSATSKTDDVAGWAHRLGRTDAIMVTDADSSADPASVLRLRLPVAWLDGRPATPGSWAALLVDRLVAI